jgi:small subunit ribosomal protein S6
MMVIVDSDVDDNGVSAVNKRVTDLVEADGGRVATTDLWGKRRFAYPLKKKLEGIYVVFEIVTPAAGLSETDRFLRLADDIVRHKIVRLPDAEAERRGLLGDAPAAAEPAQDEEA